MNLLFCIDKGYLSLLLCCIFSIARSGGADKYDAYILHSDLEQKDIADIRAGIPNTVTPHFLEVNPDKFSGFPESDRYPKQIYYRLIAPLILPKTLDRILYLDADTVTINPLVKLYEMDFESNYYVACTHTGKILTKFNQVRLGNSEERPYINTGVLLINLPAIRERINLADIQEFVSTKGPTLVLPDQDILTALYGDKVKLADSLLYNLSDRTLLGYNIKPFNEKLAVDWVRQNTSIIHYMGRNKPWKKGYVGILDVFWEELQRDMRLCIPLV